MAEIVLTEEQISKARDSLEKSFPKAELHEDLKSCLVYDWHHLLAFMGGREELEVILNAKGIRGIKKHLL